MRRLVRPPPTIPSHVIAWRLDKEEERETGRECIGLCRWVGEDDEEE